jgi:outer membrane protein TolC
MRALTVGVSVALVTMGAACRSYVPAAVEAERRGILSRLVDVSHSGAESLPETGALADYVAFAVRRNAGLHAAAARWDSAMNRIGPAAAPPDPHLAYAGFLEPVETRTGPQRNRLALTQRLPWPGKLTRRGDIAASEAERRWWSVEGVRRHVARDVGRHWYEAAFVARATAIMRDHLLILQRLEAVVQRRIQAGGRQDDLVRLQVEIGRVTDEVARLEANAPALMAQLAAVCDYRGSQPLPAPRLEAEATAVPAIAELIATMLTGSPELAGLREGVRKAEHMRKLAELGPIPDLTVGALWIDTGSARIPNQRDSGDDPFAVTLGLSLPIWVGKYSGAMRAAASDRAAAESSLRERENTLRATLHLHRFRLEDAARQLVLYRDTLLPRAQQALTLAETAYRSGKGDLLSVIDSERMLLNFQRAFWRAAADYGRSRVEIDAIVGVEVR